MNKSGFIIITIGILLGIAIILLKPTTQPESQSNTTQQLDNISQQEDQMPTDSKTLVKPELTIDSFKTYTATLTTDKGDIVIQLDAKNTPITANNFIYLAKQDFYNDTIFHRAITGFMIQGGDPTGTGAGSPGYRFDDEPFTGEYKKGTVAMANAGPNTNGSQFFIMHEDYPLPPNYVIFAHVTAGQDVVDAIATAPVEPSSSGENSKPTTPVVIKEVSIAEK